MRSSMLFVCSCLWNASYSWVNIHFVSSLCSDFVTLFEYSAGDRRCGNDSLIQQRLRTKIEWCRTGGGFSSEECWQWICTCFHITTFSFLSLCLEAYPELESFIKEYLYSKTSSFFLFAKILLEIHPTNNWDTFHWCTINCLRGFVSKKRTEVNKPYQLRWCCLCQHPYILYPPPRGKYTESIKFAYVTHTCVPSWPLTLM